MVQQRFGPSAMLAHRPDVLHSGTVIAAAMPLPPQQLAGVPWRAAPAPTMIVLHTLGAVAIRVGTRKVLPSATRAFGALFFLTLERGRAIPRGELQALLFPNQRDDAAAHNLRQLLYRVRNLGAPVRAVDAGVVLTPDEVRDDYSTLCAGTALTPNAVRAVTEGILPGYAPTFSKPFTRWVERQRTRIQNAVLGRFASELADLRAAGRWRDIEPIARACLALDPLNEEATLALAEFMALNGQKANAVRLLDGYLEEVTPYGKDLRVPAHVLRTRISEHVPNDGFPKLGSGPFVGRDAEMAELWRHYRAAKQGTPAAVVIHGEAGIGKTRLGTEFLRAAALDGATCLKAECASHDIRRPLGVFVDLVPKLLAAPGGLGVAPSAMRQLQKLTQPELAADRGDLEADPQHLFNVIVAAVTDLVDAVSEENPVVILVDDAHFMDPASAELTFALVTSPSSRRCAFALTSRTKLSLARDASEPDAVNWLRLRPLDEKASRSLFSSLARTMTSNADSAAATDRLALAAGNPLFLRSLLMEPATVEGGALPVSLTALLTQRVQRLTDATLRAFVAAVLLGKHCRLDRLTRLAGLGEGELLQAIQTLENQGFLEADGADIRSAHPLLSQTALAEFPPVTMRLMHSTAAMVLEAEAQPRHNIGMLWDAAEHWHQAGATDKAIELLRSCAEYCRDIGQPEVSCDLLERATAISPTREQPALLRQLVEAARVAEDFPLVIDAVRRHRTLTHGSPAARVHDDLELDVTQAQRFSGLSVVEQVPYLQRCVAERHAPPTHRLRAACQLLAGHELNLDMPGSFETFKQLSAIQCESPTEFLYRNRAVMLHCVFVGDLKAAISAATTLLKLSDKAPSPTVGVRLTVEAALSLFRSGECDHAIDVLRHAFTRGRELGMLSSLIDASSMLAWMHRALQDDFNADEWDATSDRLYREYKPRRGRISHYLSNKVEFAIDEGRPAIAQRWLEEAGARYSEISTPRSKILALAFSLRIHQLENAPPESTAPIRDLAEAHELGKRCGLHDNYVEAYWHELHRSGRAADAANMLRAYLETDRCDGFPPARSLRALAPWYGATAAS
jgi:DNA-binding SARP family transcriptional activator